MKQLPLSQESFHGGNCWGYPHQFLKLQSYDQLVVYSSRCYTYLLMYLAFWEGGGWGVVVV